MLTVEPTHRITAKEALLHPFIETSDTESEKTAKRKVKVRMPTLLRNTICS